MIGACLGSRFLPTKNNEEGKDTCGSRRLFMYCSPPPLFQGVENWLVIESGGVLASALVVSFPPLVVTKCVRYRDSFSDGFERVTGFFRKDLLPV